MRTTAFRERLLASATPAAEMVRAPEDEIFVAYDWLKEHGIVFTRVHIRRLISRGLFPAAVQLSPNRVAWRLSDLAQWKSSPPTALIKA